MSFRNCIDDAELSGDITPEQATTARDLFDELDAEYQGKMNKAAAQAKAGQDTFDTLRRQAIRRKRNKVAQLRSWQQITKNMDGYTDRFGRKDPFSGALAIFEQDTLSTFSSVTQRIEEVKSEAFSGMSSFLGEFRRNLIGEVRQKAKLKNVAREIFGESTGDASASELAQAWNKTAEMLRKRFNMAGGAIPKRSDWGLPQVHDQLAVMKAGYTQWRDYIAPRLNASKMVDETTGLPFSPQKLELALRDVYESISTDGMNKLKPGGQSSGKSIANRRQDHRFLVFKDADTWLQYQEKFGNSNVFDTMIAHIDMMARDIGMMEIMGPNPKATATFIKQTLAKKAGGDPAMADRARGTSKTIDELYMAITGNVNAPINSFFAATFAGTRQVLQSAQLGSAAIAAITDINFQRMARNFAGLPQTRMLGQYLKFLNPLDAKEKGELAIRLGLIAEGWTSIASAQMRYVGDISGPEVTRRVADFVMRASLLSPMTQAGRWSFGMEFMGTLADSAGKKFDDLPPMLKKTLERYDIGADRWDMIRATDLYDEQGAKFLRPLDVKSRTDLTPEMANQLGIRLMEMINTETNFAVPSTSIRGRVALTGETRPGTIAGELTRSFAMYKGFGITLLNTHLMRGMNQAGVKGKGVYFADLLISATVMGALAMQLKEMSKGRDPRPMDSPEFWGAAFLQGGGLGIYGDFLFSDVNRFGGGLAQTIAGPVVGFANDVRNLTLGNMMEVASGEDSNAASEMVKFVQRYTPGSSLWYMRLGLERMLFDRLQLYTDPKAPQKFRSVQNKYKREYDQDYWWAPGKPTPSRAPNISSALPGR